MQHDIYWHAKTRPLYITTLASIGAIAVVGRLLFTFLPNVQPMTVIFLLMTVIFGPISASIVMLISILISSIYHSYGIWVLYQLIAYTCLIWLTNAFMRYEHLHTHRLLYALYAGATGYLYGLMMTLCYAFTVQLTNPLAYYLAGLPFDTYHAVGNFGFYLILTPILTPLLTKIRSQLL